MWLLENWFFWFWWHLTEQACKQLSVEVTNGVLSHLIVYLLPSRFPVDANQNYRCEAPLRPKTLTLVQQKMVVVVWNMVFRRFWCSHKSEKVKIVKVACGLKMLSWSCTVQGIFPMLFTDYSSLGKGWVWPVDGVSCSCPFLDLFLISYLNLKTN